MDETALYYKFNFNNNLASKQLKDSGYNKLRIMANFCCNTDGSYKLNIFFIVKAFRPYAFRDIKRIESLGYQ
jgi:hypothetical protein